MRLLLKAVDWVAMALAFLGFIVLIAALIFGALSYAWHTLRSMWGHSDDRIVLIVVAAAVAWCGFRWKELNRRP